MLVDDIGDVTITNDGATILKLLEVEHPAAKILVELAELQDREVGDGTTSVVILAAELLKRANELVRNKIHPTNIIAGFRLAMRESVKYIQNKLARDVETLGKDALLQCAKTSMSSKIIGAEEEFFANLVVDACLSVKTYNDMGDIKYPIKAINILKAHGKSLKESLVIHGYALNLGRAAEGMPKMVKNAKIACIDFNLQKTKMLMGVQVLVNDPKELEKIREQEFEITAKRIQMILAAGANVILCSKGIDDMALKYFVEAGAIACRRVNRDDLRRIAKATGAQVMMSLSDMDGGETFDESMLGTAGEVVEQRVADDDMVVIKESANNQACTILLRGANDYMLDEIDRSVHDALCIVKRTLESGKVVAGGGAVEAALGAASGQNSSGAVEAALSIYLENMATTLGSREQLAIAEFANALLVIPKVLTVNAAKDSTELVAKLRAIHHQAQSQEGNVELSGMGLDLVNGELRDNLASGILEPALSKVKSIQFATEAAITILRIDDMIRLESQEGQ